MNTENFVYVAAYGTLKEGHGNNVLMRLPGNKYIGRGITKEKYSMYSSGIPFVIKKPKVVIVVDVYQVAIQNLPRLDSLEGHPHWYRRELVTTIVNGKEYESWLYFMTEENRVKSYNYIADGNY